MTEPSASAVRMRFIRKLTLLRISSETENGHNGYAIGYRVGLYNQYHMLPLAGIRVIDFGRYIAGPYCGMLLADMGADVIRIDRPGGSEDRYVGPVTDNGEGGMFLSLNRNKRSFTLDTGDPGAAEIIRRLVTTADVVIANLPIDVMRRMGIDYDSLCAIKPDIILGMVSAFGPDGPYAQ